MKALSIFALIISSLGTISAEAQPLRLSGFLEQVHSGHQGVKASSEAKEGSLARSKEAGMTYSPNGFFIAQRSVDKKVSPFIHYDKLSNDYYSFGINQQTSIGTQAKLSYSLFDTQYTGLIAGIGPNPPKYYEGRPELSLTQSLWRNGFGSETRAQVEVMEASALATHFGETFKFQSYIVEAESLYWRLALARENVAVQKSALDRAQKIHEWSARRVRLQLADKSDLLQADAALLSRQLQFQSEQDSERAAARAFNLARGISSDEVKEDLEPISTQLIQAMKVPERIQSRADVLAAEQQQKAAGANARLGEDRNKPTLEVYGTLAFNSHEARRNPAITESLKTKQTSYIVGVKLSAPLDFWNSSSIRQGFRKEEAAADLGYQRKLVEQESDWLNLTLKLKESKKRLEIAQKIEDAQKTKLLHEKERLNKGRTTTYQVLLFEQDYSQAQLARILSEAEVLNLIAQMKLFGGLS